jgi:hypothetical protein
MRHLIIVLLLDYSLEERKQVNLAAAAHGCSVFLVPVWRIEEGIFSKCYDSRVTT